MTIGMRWVGGNIGWIGGRPGVADGSRSPAQSARICVDRLRDALDGRGGVVRDAHLLQPQRQAGPEAHDDPAGQHLVERRAGHRQDDRMTGERVHGAERDPESAVVAGHRAAMARGDRRGEADRVALEVGVVDPDRIEPRSRAWRAQADDIVDVASGGESEADRSGERAHRADAQRVSR